MPPIDCPFEKINKILQDIQERAKIIIVDFHAEATSEKRALGWFLDGKVSAVVGTHTHVQTADEEILPNSTAYISDAGMCGGFDSVIGMKKDAALYRMLYGINKRLEPSKSDLRFNGVLITTDMEGKAVSIKRIQRKIKDGNEDS
jgi:metallophosphoesterase (TIGR00282 family)